MLRRLIPFIIAFPMTGLAQASHQDYAAPDSIRRVCDSIIRTEVGEAMFKSCVSFEKSERNIRNYRNQEKVIDFHMHYVFTFPSDKKATVKFTLIHSAYAGKVRVFSSAFYRPNQTDLPPDTGEKGMKIISHNEARKIALKANEKLAKNQDRMQGDFFFTQSTFVWHFSFSEPDHSSSEMEQYITHYAYVDPYTGKVLDKGTRAW